MAGNPTAVLYPNGNHVVHHRGANNQLFFWLWNAASETWTLNWKESEAHPMAGEPTAVLYPNGNQYVYYRCHQQPAWKFSVVECEQRNMDVELEGKRKPSDGWQPLRPFCIRMVISTFIIAVLITSCSSGCGMRLVKRGR